MNSFVYRFLDNRMFATCSDDSSVRLWDARYLKRHVRSLHGHANWVKNVEYAQEKQQLITSGFDGNVFAWHINRFKLLSLLCNKPIYKCRFFILPIVSAVLGYHAKFSLCYAIV